MTIGPLTLATVLLVAAMLLAIWRLARGPTMFDRIMAFDAVVICAAGIVVVLSQAWRTPHFVELILIVSSLGFFTTVAFAFYLQRTDPEAEASRKGRRDE